MTPGREYVDAYTKFAKSVADDGNINFDISNDCFEHAKILCKILIKKSESSLLIFTNTLEQDFYNIDMRGSFEKSIENGLEYIRIILDGTNKQKMPEFTDFAKKINEEKGKDIFKIYMLNKTIEDYSHFYIHDTEGKRKSYFHFYVSDEKRTRIEKKHIFTEDIDPIIEAIVNFNNEPRAKELTDRFDELMKMKLCTIV